MGFWLVHTSSPSQPSPEVVEEPEMLRTWPPDPLAFGIAHQFPKCQLWEKALKTGWHKAAGSTVELGRCGSQTGLWSPVPKLRFPFKMRSNTKFWNN